MLQKKKLLVGTYKSSVEKLYLLVENGDIVLKNIVLKDIAILYHRQPKLSVDGKISNDIFKIL